MLARDAITNTALLKILTADDGNYPLGSRVSDIDRGSDLSAAIDDVGRGSAKVGGGERVRGRAGSVGGASKPADKVRSRAAIGAFDGDESTLNPASVARRIKTRYLRQIKACYEKALKDDAKLGGKIVLRFKVGEAGRVTSAVVKGFNSSVDTCIKKRMSGWRFLAPKDADGNPTSAQFSIPIVLKSAT